MGDPLNVSWPIKHNDWKDEYALDKADEIGYSRAYINYLKDKYPNDEFFDNITRKANIKANFDKNNYALNNLLLNAQNPKKHERYLPKLQAKVNKLKIEIENKDTDIEKDLVISPELLQACEDYLKAFKIFNKYEFGSRMRESLWRPPTGKDDGGYDDDSGGPMYKKYMSHFDTLKQSGQGKTKTKKTKKRGGKQVKSSNKKKHNKKHKRKTRSKTRK